MKYFSFDKTQRLKLTRDLTKHIKRGNPWVFSDAVEKIKAPEGTYVLLVSHKNEVLAHGFYSPNINLSFRMLTLGDKKFNDAMVEKRFRQAIENKKHLLSQENKCFRLLNGEGDELPGMVADFYDGVLVLKLDGAAAEAFWKKEAVAEFFMQQTDLPVKCVYFKRKNREEEKGLILAGECDNLTDLEFLEHGVKFRTNIIDAAKTGFFLDQRENRNFIRSVSKDKSLLNLFGYTGGFSIYAGLGGASKVTTVDIAPNAIKASEVNWQINLLSPEKHEALCEDAFEFVAEAQKAKRQWDIVITDPPSFAPNQKAVESAREAYTKIFADSLRLVKDGGFFAASSCSGHISFESFLEIVQEALSKSRRRGKVLLIKGQPEDHPFPFALPEMRYLKFVYLQVFQD
ncbi:class I SAM-dependent rRNA methyltransferase [Peredibacter starrii]|uniref:Class I SAM-dependent rRNA methyltransferase n=1 Tax=Peredibacter starrii TaxID=28202 RepID=A0AAX4HJT9_9BACT|nr:class I SAM-dependent rRNA methyltransferase [Peredibacter starrii]WPU63452.1 class I SAM-dependent rRNA methyltransferase [Peredibacter starrii]